MTKSASVQTALTPPPSPVFLDTSKDLIFTALCIVGALAGRGSMAVVVNVGDR